MDTYWSVENAGWTSPAGALVTPWSGHVLPVPALPYPASAAEVLRMPSREALQASGVPQQRDQAEQQVCV